MTLLRDLAKGTLLPDTFARILTRGLNEFSTAYLVSTVATTDSARYRIPLVSRDVTAAWVPEGQEIGLSDMGLDELVVTPQKVAGLTSASREMVTDSNESIDRVFSTSLMRAMTSAIDGAYFVAKDAMNVPADLHGIEGIDHQTGVQQVKAGTAWENLDPFAEAMSLAAAQGATTTAFVANPATILKLQKLKTATNANTPLLGVDPAEPTKQTILGVPLLPARAVAENTVFAIAKDYSFLVQREKFDFEVSEHYMFSADKVAFKAVARVAFAFPFPEAHVKITLS